MLVRLLETLSRKLSYSKDEEIDRNGIWVYCMSHIPGQTWSQGIRRRGPEARIIINRTLARILSKGYVEGSSDHVIDNQLRPHLELLISSDDSKVQRFHADIQDMLEKADQLKSLCSSRTSISMR
jgi:hypothetical protein